MKFISSRDNVQFKSLRTLVEDAREQRQRQQTLIDGVHLLEAYQQSGGVPVQILVAESAQQNSQVVELLNTYGSVPALLMKDGLFKELSGVATPVGIAAVIAIPQVNAESALGTSCVLLDAVQDAGNVGSILRTAAAAGIRNVMLGNGCAGVWTPRVLRAAQGAHFSLSLREQIDLQSVVPQLDMPTIATVARDGCNLYEMDLRGPVAWILGNEGAGVSASLIKSASLHATIPLMAAESLNVAAAAAICLFEEVRQKQCAH